MILILKLGSRNVQCVVVSEGLFLHLRKDSTGIDFDSTRKICEPPYLSKLERFYHYDIDLISWKKSLLMAKS